MKKILMLCAVLTFASSQLFAYWVVLKDGTRYDTVAPPSVVGGKATFTLRNGQIVQVTADAIDRAKSEEATRLGGGTVIATEQRPVPEAKAPSSLGSQIRLRRQQQAAAAANAGAAPVPAPRRSWAATCSTSSSAPTRTWGSSSTR
jgi:hypothetical protein